MHSFSSRLTSQRAIFTAHLGGGQKLVRHYKGKYYIVKSESRHTESEEELTNYRALYDRMEMWSRPSQMFKEEVEYQGVVQQRFTPIYLGSEEDKQLFEILEFSSFAHRDQKRKFSGLPYFNHPVEVAASIAAHHPDMTLAIKAAILHDVAEDTEATIDEISFLFGEDIARVVAEVTDDKSKEKVAQKLCQIENAGKKSKEASLVKLADKLHNCKDFAKCLELEPALLAPILCFSKKVVDNLSYTDSPLKTEFEELFNRHLAGISPLEFDSFVEKYLESKR